MVLRCMAAAGWLQVLLLQVLLLQQVGAAAAAAAAAVPAPRWGQCLQCPRPLAYVLSVLCALLQVHAVHAVCGGFCGGGRLM